MELSSASPTGATGIYKGARVGALKANNLQYRSRLSRSDIPGCVKTRNVAQHMQSVTHRTPL